MKLNKYMQFMTKEFMMGPNCVRLADELSEKYPEGLKGNVLDLGCGCGLTSLYLARETGAETVFAQDLWVNAGDNLRRFRQWGVEGKAIPIHADANDTPFADDFFDAIFSVDAYHYFAREKGYFQEKIMPLLKKGGCALIAVPGLKEEVKGEPPRLLTDWAGDEWDYFHSCKWWKALLEEGYEDLVEVDTWEAADTDKSWDEWFRTGHEFALNDKKYMDMGLKDMLNFVMIRIVKK